MAASSRKALAGSIHRIREFELEKVCLAEEFDILQIVGEGWFGKILLVEHRGTDTEMVLKALPKPYVSLRDFYREFHYGLHLGVHKNIITTYDVAFETAGFYVFSQEYAPLGDLTSNVSDTGIGELHTKRVAKQLGAALDHVHAVDLVHRDVKLDNILVFKSDFSRIKLCDFGETRKCGTEIRRRNEWLPYSPPEILQTPVEGVYKATTSHDVWQFGIVIFVCLTGCLPWQKAALDDPRYVRYLNWYNSSNPLRKMPKLFKLVSSRAQKMFKKFLEPRIDKRPPGLGDLHKYMDDRWMVKGINEKNGTDGVEVDELCPSMYSFHSDINEKNKLLHVLLQHGIETTVDRVAKKARIKDWIQNSVIQEEDENDNDDSNCSSACQSDEEEPRISIGLHPVEKNHQRWSSMRFNNEKHINPRTGKVYDKGKTTNENIQTVSYDMQQVQPLTSSDVTVKYGVNKDESHSHSSTKDSAYGSLDFKVSPAQNSSYSSTPHNNIANGQYPSQKLQQDLQKQNITYSTNTPMNAAQIQFYNNNKNQHSNLQSYRSGSNISSSKSSPFTSSADFKNSQQTLQKSASTSTTTLTRSSPQNQKQNTSNINSRNSRDSPVSRVNDSPKNSSRNNSPKNFTPMKDGPYDLQKSVPIVESEPQQDTTFIVQGQMKINPYGPNKMINPRMQKYATFNGKQNTSRENVLEGEDEDSIKKLRQMLLDNKTGLSD